MPEWTRDQTHTRRNHGSNFEGSAGLDMGHTHAGVTVGHAIHVVGPERHSPVHIGCFGWRQGEDVEEAWNDFAQDMWRRGLQPHEDEPVFSVTEGGVTYDHYYLISIYDEDCE